jgi:hypothetical protein
MARRNGSPNYLAFAPEEVIVIPQEDRGKLAENSYGPYFLRHWQDGRFSCMPEEAERRLLDCGVRAGVPVGITKMQYGKSAVWKVRVIGAGPVTIEAKHANGHATPAEVTRSPIPESKYAPAPNGNTPHTLEDQLRASIAQVQAEKPREPKNLLERCAVAAVDAALFVESYAAQHGRPLTVPAESIAAWASTLLINAH